MTKFEVGDSARMGKNGPIIKIFAINTISWAIPDTEEEDGKLLYFYNAHPDDEGLILDTMFGESRKEGKFIFGTFAIDDPMIDTLPIIKIT
jgi:hypothetical protein